MNNLQNTPENMIRTINNLITTNEIQSQGITSGYNITNPSLTASTGKIIKDKDNKVYNINNQGVATYFPSTSVYDSTSGQRGVLGTGNFALNSQTIPKVSFALNPNAVGYDKNSKLYLNRNVRPGQSTGDETRNIFAGVKTPIKFDYKGCSMLPSTNNYMLDKTKGLNILSASYGLNCAKHNSMMWARGNRTNAVREYISKNPGKTTYNIGRKVINFGDPFPNCNKHMEITYQCNGKTHIINRSDGKFDSGEALNLTCDTNVNKVSLKKCYYDALEKGLSYFGLGNVDKNTNLGTCYTGNSSILDKPWQNPGIPIWKIDMRKDLNYTGNSLYGIFLGRNNNVYFSLNGIHTNDKYNFYELCKMGKLPNTNIVNANIFNAPWNNDVRVLFLSKGNLYIFHFPPGVSRPIDLRQNPDNYLQYLVYSSGTQGKDLYAGWNVKDISNGASSNILITHGGILGALKIGESIYSLDGKLKLTLNPDYTLVLYTGDPTVSGCVKNMLNEMVGYDGVAVNQVNNIKQQEEGNFGKLAYVNRLGSAYVYNDQSLYGHHDLYTSNPGYTIKNINTNTNVTKFNDVDGFIYDNSAASIDKCKTQCSKTGSCIGTVIDNKSCYLARKINNNDVTYKEGTAMNLRVPKIYKQGQPSYKLYSNSSLPGGDLGSSQANTANQCLELCNKNIQCNSIQVRRNKNDVTCYPKTFKEPTTLNKGVVDSDVFIKNSPLAGVSYLITPHVNVVNPNKFSNYNISPTLMSKSVTDVTLMPESITKNFLQTSSEIQKLNNNIVKNTHNLILEPFVSTRIYKNNAKDLNKLGNIFNGYIKNTPPLLTNIGTLNKMVSNSSIHMRYMNIMYSILFIALCIILVAAFTISL
jgi:hypothetical protein